MHDKSFAVWQSIAFPCKTSARRPVNCGRIFMDYLLPEDEVIVNQFNNTWLTTEHDKYTR
jgi:hypothetical protein